MPWTEFTRRQHSRTGGKYASDLTDAEWAVIESVLNISVMPPFCRLALFDRAPFPRE